jgi:hypothetical protein
MGRGAFSDLEWSLGGGGADRRGSQAGAVVNEFWRHPEQWPLDTAEHVFLARGIKSIAEAMHGGELDLGSKDAEQRARFNETIDEAARLFAVGTLKAVARSFDPIITDWPLEPRYWCADPGLLRHRFEYCEIDLSTPMVRRPRRRDFMYPNSNSRRIFIERPGLDSYLQHAGSGASTSTRDARADEPARTSSYWPMPDKARGPKQEAALRELKVIFKDEPGVPRSLSMQTVADRVNARIGGGRVRHVSPDTIERLLKGGE